MLYGWEKNSSSVLEFFCARNTKRQKRRVIKILDKILEKDINMGEI
jgi:hypothetical protein